jgi:hypothetical protein
MDPNQNINPDDYQKQLDYIKNFGGTTDTPAYNPKKTPKFSKKIVLLVVLGVISAVFFVLSATTGNKKNNQVVQTVPTGEILSTEERSKIIDSAQSIMNKLSGGNYSELLASSSEGDIMIRLLGDGGAIGSLIGSEIDLKTCVLVQENTYAYFRDVQPTKTYRVVYASFNCKNTDKTTVKFIMDMRSQDSSPSTWKLYFITIDK